MSEPQTALAAAQDEIDRLGRYIDRLHGRVTSARRLLRAAREEMKMLQKELAAVIAGQENK